MGGIVWQVIPAAAAAAELAIVEATTEAEAAAAFASAESIAVGSSSAYRPSLWGQPAVYSITLPGTAAQRSGSASSVSSATPITFDASGTIHLDTGIKEGTPDTVYVFDAILRADHSKELEKTRHPSQAGTSFSDHAYLMPARVTLSVGVSDVMDSFTPGQFSGAGSKSVSAFQTLLMLQGIRQPLTLATRLNIYSNMLVAHIGAAETHETAFGLRAEVTFEEMQTGTITVQTVSARSQTTDSTNIGTKQVTPVPSTIAGQHQVTSSTNVPGAGTYSSANVAEDDPADLGS